MKKILVTGSAGFIGFHLFKRLQEANYKVYGIDNLNDYYDVNLKLGRLKECGFNVDEIAYRKELKSANGGTFLQLNLEDRESVEELFNKEKFDIVCHLAAQAGVRYSLENPHAYINSNVVGFLNILEGCRNYGVKHLAYASSSSVYGLNSKIPFSVKDNVDLPVSLYAATKKSNELMAHCYSHLYNFATTGLRFFTVYGPWGRPDMALFKFTKAILNDEAIPVFNHGDLSRDFTYIDDIIEGIWRILNLNETKENYPEKLYDVFNIGNGNPVKLLDFINAIENATGKKAIINSLPMQAGDVYKTWADTEYLNETFNFKPIISIQDGVNNFVDWYRKYYKK